MDAGFPVRFVDSVIRNFESPKPEYDEDLPLIPAYFFEAPPPFILIEVPYCPENETVEAFHQKVKVVSE